MSARFVSDARIPRGETVERELVILKKQVGGELGRLELGPISIYPVLQLDGSNFALGREVPTRDRMLFAQAGMDLHPAASTRDRAWLRERYRRHYGR
jgi:hypothetical protein